MIIAYPDKAIVMYSYYGEQFYFREYIDAILVIHNFIIDFDTPYINLITFVGR